VKCCVSEEKLKELKFPISEKNSFSRIVKLYQKMLKAFTDIVY
jgi:hypothetical protein